MAATNGQKAKPEVHDSRLYAEFSHFYDVIFGRVFVPRVSRLIRSLNLVPGSRVLEIGVGTGMSLSAYPGHCEVVGLDLSEPMLREARHKIDRMSWHHIRVERGDATDLPFPDDRFDVVCAFHVVTVVTDHDRLMREATRVLVPGGRLVMVNRFQSPHPLVGGLEKRLEPLARYCGWKTLSLDEVFDGHTLGIESARRGGPYGLFTAVVARNLKPAPAPV